MKKLTIFTNHYYPENFRINAISKEFSKNYNVSVVTQVPNYPKGSFFDNYSVFKRRNETIDNIKVTRLAVIPRGNNVIMLSLNYLSYIVSSFFYRAFTKEKTDHVFVYITSPIFISYAALAYAKKNNVKATLYLLDLWPGSLISMLNIKSKFIINKLENACIKLYKRFDNIIVSSNRFIEVLEDYGINKDKITYIPQHADEIVNKPILIQPIKEKVEIVFTGNIGQAQNLDVLVDTAKHLKFKGFNEVKFTLVGDGRYKSELLSNIKESEVEDYFEFLGRVDYNKIQGILSQYHFGFVSLNDDKTLNKTLPAKVQSYMAYGIPILASANEEVPYIIEKSKSGISVSANDANALANTIMKLKELPHQDLQEMGNNGFVYSKNNFKLEEIMETFKNIMKEGSKYV